MTPGNPLRTALGLLVGAAVGGFCRMVDLPSPAPAALPGALLVVAMTAGYLAVDRWLALPKD